MRPVSVELTPAKQSPTPSTSASPVVTSPRVRKVSAHHQPPGVDPTAATANGVVAGTSIPVAGNKPKEALKELKTPVQEMSAAKPGASVVLNTVTASAADKKQEPAVVVETAVMEETESKGDSTESVTASMSTKIEVDEVEDSENWTDEVVAAVLTTCYEEPTLTATWKRMAAEFPDKSIDEVFKSFKMVKIFTNKFL